MDEHSSILDAASKPEYPSQAPEKDSSVWGHIVQQQLSDTHAEHRGDELKNRVEALLEQRDQIEAGLSLSTRQRLEEYRSHMALAQLV